MLAVVKAGFEFLFYSRGILDEDNTKWTQYHPLLIVGYGQEKDLEYWICKNSFGKEWGEEGYVRVAVKDG